ncbi:MAG: lamin tail domain-containing protein [Gammaproteobacteria bacterium]
MVRRNTNILAACALLVAVGQAQGANLSVAGLPANGIVITEYLANPVGVADSAGEYFEIFNTTTSSVDLNGLVVRDDGSNAFTVGALVVAPRSFAVFSASAGVSLGLTPDYVYGGMALTNTADEIGLYRPDDTLINKVSYTDGDWFGPGIAHELGALSAASPSLLSGPTLGSDFVAATLSLPLGNFGSPGAAGNTLVGPPNVPLPAAAWMFASALGMLGWSRKPGAARVPSTGDRHGESRAARAVAGGMLADGACGVRC